MEIVDIHDGNFVLKFAKSIYSEQAILSTTYKFTNYCYVHVENVDNEHYGVFFRPKEEGLDVQQKIDEFCNELIDQQVRHNLQDSNRAIKELIIRKAFFPFDDENEV